MKNLSTDSWYKSKSSTNYNCVECRIGTGWVKSTRSGNNGQCVEVQHGGAADVVAIRNSNNPEAGVTFVPAPSFVDFTAAIQRGEFEL